MINELNKIAKFLVSEITNEIARKNKNSSGKLARSLKSGVDNIPEGFEIYVMAESYFKFQEEGVQGARKARSDTRYSFREKRPPLQAMIDFVKNRAIASGEKEILNAAFAIQYKVWRDGFKGMRILEDILKKVTEQKLPEIQQAAIKDISIKIDSIINGNFNR